MEWVSSRRFAEAQEVEAALADVRAEVETAGRELEETVANCEKLRRQACCERCARVRERGKFNEALINDYTASFA